MTVLVTILAIGWTLHGSVAGWAAASRAATRAANLPPQTIAALRSALAEEYKALVGRLIQTGLRATATSTEYLARLRIELRNAILATTDASGELDLAVKRAAVRDRVARINAIENAYGLQDGARTTRWNVLSAEELNELEAGLRQTLRGLLAEAAPLPASATPNSLRGRIYEIRAELDAITIEKAARGENAVPKLVSISTTPTTADPITGLAQIRQFEEQADREAERSLLIEINERLAWANDASLTAVKSTIAKSPHYAELVESIRKNEWRGGWPPSRGPRLRAHQSTQFHRSARRTAATRWTHFTMPPRTRFARSHQETTSAGLTHRRACPPPQIGCAKRPMWHLRNPHGRCA
jgi:hypothetical protein